MSNLWVREALQRAGRQQKDLAKAWGVSEASVSRWMEGTQNQDLPTSRLWILAQMIGQPCEDVIRRLGLAGEAARLPPSTAVMVNEVPMGTRKFDVQDNGEAHVMIHMKLALPVAVQLLELLGKAGPGSITGD